MCASAPRVKVPPVSGKSTRRPSAVSSARVFVGTDANTGEQVRIPAVKVFCECLHIDYYPEGGVEDIRQMCHHCIKEERQERNQKAFGILFGGQ
jgi:hypothetical protein